MFILEEVTVERRWLACGCKSLGSSGPMGQELFLLERLAFGRRSLALALSRRACGRRCLRHRMLSMRDDTVRQLLVWAPEVIAAASAAAANTTCSSISSSEQPAAAAVHSTRLGLPLHLRPRLLLRRMWQSRLQRKGSQRARQWHSEASWLPRRLT